jgi:hypothetical protein
MIEYIPYKPEHAKEIIAKGAVGICPNTPEEKIDTAFDAKLNGDAYTCVSDGVIVSCGGYEVAIPGIGQAWFICLNGINPLITKDNKRKFLEMVKSSGLKRVQAPMRPEFPLGIRFAEYMGFQYEETILVYTLGDF